MLSHACPSSVLANGEWHSRERLVQSVDVIRKIGRTPAVPAEIHVVRDYIGCGSERYAIDPASLAVKSKIRKWYSVPSPV
jgi:hypothetical protein